MRSLLTILSGLLLYAASAQESRTLVWESAISVQYQLVKNYRFSSSIAKRVSFLESQDGNKTELSFLEINQFVTRKITPSLRLSLGYKYRTNEPVEELDIHEHRFTEQATLTHLENRIRVVSRISLEQRIFNALFAHRYRYRISVDLPLSGESINRNEFYLVGSNELLYEAVDVNPNTWEYRISGSIGYLINKGVKAQIGLTYRLEDLNIEIVGVPFVHTSLIMKLN